MSRALLATLALSACGAAARPPVVLTVVDGNPGKAPLGTVQAMVESDGALALFGSGGATVLRAGAIAATDATVRAWRPRSAAVVPAADGGPAWVVAIAADGRALRLAASGALEEIGARYGIGAAVGVAPLGGRSLALALPDGVAVGDGTHVARYPGRFVAIAGAAGRLVGISRDEVEIWDLGRARAESYTLPGAAQAGMTAAGQAVVATADAVWTEGADGGLRRALTLGAIHGLAVAGQRIWVAAGADLVLMDAGAVVRVQGARVPPDAHLAAAADGGVWVASASGIALYHSADADTWHTEALPVFTRVCSRCHLPGGSADVDLSTAAAWQEHRADIRRRVLERRDMPPRGTPFGAPDRDAVARWVGGL
jgi:hypothetical protein